MVTTKKVECQKFTHYKNKAKLVAFMSYKAKSFLTSNKYILWLIYNI
jgi:hypothetical protein